MLEKCPPLARLVGRVMAWRDPRRKVTVGELRPVLAQMAKEVRELKLETDVVVRGLEWERGCRIGVSFQCLALADELALFVGQQKRMAIRSRVTDRANRMIDLYNARLRKRAANPCRFYHRAGAWQQAEMGDPCVYEAGHDGEHESGIDVARRTAEITDGPRIVVP
jgi:hypothetical protein